MGAAPGGVVLPAQQRVNLLEAYHVVWAVWRCVADAQWEFTICLHVLDQL